MERVKNKILYGALGMSAGLAAMALAGRCSGSGCSACLGCAAPGICVLIASIFKTRRKEKNGMA